MYDLIGKKQKSVETRSLFGFNNYQRQQPRQSRRSDRRSVDRARGLGYTPGEVAAMLSSSPFLGRELDVPESLSGRIQDSFGINSNELSLRESPAVAIMGARATVQGNIISFAPGEYQPNTADGLKVLGHELYHVRDQAMGDIRPNVEGTNINFDSNLESKSDSMGDAFASGSLTGASPVSVASADGAVSQGLFNPLATMSMNMGMMASDAATRMSPDGGGGGSSPNQLTQEEEQQMIRYLFYCGVDFQNQANYREDLYRYLGYDVRRRRAYNSGDFVGHWNNMSEGENVNASIITHSGHDSIQFGGPSGEGIRYRQVITTRGEQNSFGLPIRIGLSEEERTQRQEKGPRVHGNETHDWQPGRNSILRTRDINEVRMFTCNAGHLSAAGSENGGVIAEDFARLIAGDNGLGSVYAFDGSLGFGPEPYPFSQARQDRDAGRPHEHYEPRESRRQNTFQSIRNDHGSYWPTTPNFMRRSPTGAVRFNYNSESGEVEHEALNNWNPFPTWEDERVRSCPEILLRNDLDEIISEQMPWSNQQATRFHNSTNDSIDTILNYDEHILTVAERHGLDPALIQAVLLRELRWVNPTDDIADAGVRNAHIWQNHMDDWNARPLWQQALAPPMRPPMNMREDSSTGLGQIFARTAINAMNWYHHDRLDISDRQGDSPPFDFNDRHQRFDVWNRLQTDNEFNIDMVGMVLHHKIASERELGFDPATTCSDEIRAILARYNGFGSDAEQYGDETYQYFRRFQEFNTQRN